MKKYLIVVLFFLFSFVLSSCSNDQLEKAIKDCKANSECYVIVDEAIQDELDSRGIQGDEMTNLELESIYNLIEQYVFTDDYFSEIQDPGMFVNVLENYLGEALPESDLTESEKNQIFDVIAAMGSQDHVLRMLNFKNLNVDSKQFLVSDDIKYVLFKVSQNRFKLEVTDYMIHEYVFDFDLNKIFYMDSEMAKPEFDILELIDGRYNTDDFYIFHNEYGIVYADFRWENEIEIMAIDSRGTMELFVQIGGYEQVSTTVNIDVLGPYLDNKSIGFTLTQFTGDTFQALYEQLSFDTIEDSNIIVQTELDYILEVLSSISDFELS